MILRQRLVKHPSHIRLRAFQVHTDQESHSVLYKALGLSSELHADMPWLTFLCGAVQVPWEEVKHELLVEKKLEAAAVDMLGRFVLLR